MVAVTKYLQLLLLGLVALQLTACARKDDAERIAPPAPNELPAETKSTPARSLATADPSDDSYEGIPDNEPVIHRARAGEPGDDGWCLAKSTRGSFSVMVPGLFGDFMVKSKTPTGGIGVMHTVAAKNAQGVEFSVLETEIIGKLPEESAVEPMLKRFKELGATVVQTEMLFADQPAVRMHVKAKGVAAEFIHLSWANSFYMLAVQSRSTQSDNLKLEADIERFFLSFKLLGRDE